MRHLINPLAPVVLSTLLLSACEVDEFADSTETTPESPKLDLPVLDKYEYQIEQSRLNIPAPSAIELKGSLPYPKRDVFNIKSIHTDHWSNKDDFIQSNTGGIGVNIVWDQWEEQLNMGACDGSFSFKYDGHCFTPNKVIEDEINYYSSKGLIVTGVLWGVPEWASNQTACLPTYAGQKRFCSPTDSTDFARFAGMIAQRFNGKQGHGRVADFVIHNEVNMNQWYKVNCGEQGNACDAETWIANYSRDFNAAYDAIKAHQPAAKVLIPFAHQFGEKLQNLSKELPVLSVKRFLQSFSKQVDDRKWRVAFHPYPKHLGKATFTAEDLPYVTYGNIGILAGWLRSEFPNLPEAWEIQLTESGINSLDSHSSEAEQTAAICDSYKNVLGTPGIENYIYHRMKDHAAEEQYGVGFGLHSSDGIAKESWSLWSTMSGRNGQRNNLDCGFENGNFTVLTQYTHKNRKPWASTRIPPEGYEALASWRLHREQQADSAMIYECTNDNGSYVSSDVNCEGSTNLGPLGYINAQGAEPMAPLFSCKDENLRFLSNEGDCQGSEVVEFLGYALNR